MRRMIATTAAVVLGATTAACSGMSDTSMSEKSVADESMHTA